MLQKKCKVVGHRTQLSDQMRSAIGRDTQIDVVEMAATHNRTEPMYNHGHIFISWLKIYCHSRWTVWPCVEVSNSALCVQDFIQGLNAPEYDLLK